MNFYKKHQHFYIPILFGVVLISIGTRFIETYGIALFLLTPLLIGFLTTLLISKNKPNELKFSTATLCGFINTIAVSLTILLVGVEGLICIIMASRILLLFVFIGCVISLAYVRRINHHPLPIILIGSTLFIGLSFVEKQQKPSLSEVKTSLIIHAPIEKVWKNVVTFPQLEEPTELLFKAGIAYPINATIEGEGIGAIRYCNFTTGSFVEPITTWNAPMHLAFDVLQQPAPMKEISYWNFDAAHLHDYFVSKNGEFRLKKIDENTTELTGTTWYTHRIYPEFYWRLWSNEIIHQIHYRVLNHIKNEAEK